MKKRNVVQFSPGVLMYQNGHPTRWWIQSKGQVICAESVGDAAEKLINATVSDVLSEQETFQNNAIELKSLVEAMRNTIATWYQIQMSRD